jgi:hypothetical protein
MWRTGDDPASGWNLDAHKTVQMACLYHFMRIQGQLTTGFGRLTGLN